MCGFCLLRLMGRLKHGWLSEFNLPTLQQTTAMWPGLEKGARQRKNDNKETERKSKSKNKGKQGKSLTTPCTVIPPLSEWPRFGSVRLQFGGGKVRSVPVFGSGGSSTKRVFLCFSTCLKERKVPVSVPGKRFRRFQFRFRFREKRF